MRAGASGPHDGIKRDVTDQRSMTDSCPWPLYLNYALYRRIRPISRSRDSSARGGVTVRDRVPTTVQEIMMQPMQPFVPWVWRDPGLLGGGFPPADPAVSDPDTVDSASADRQAHADLAGYKVEAADGHIGSIDEATYDTGNACLVVDTGPWIFGRKVLLPAGTVQRVDHADRTVYVDRTKDQIKNSPEYDEKAVTTPEYRDRVGDYYTGSYDDMPAM